MKSKIRIQDRQRAGLILILAAITIILAGCGSDSGTAPRAATPAVLDTAPPAVPTGLAASAYKSRVKVAWPLLDAPTTETRFIDKSPLHRQYSYAVTSIDEAGNESAWQEVHFAGVPEYPEMNAPR